MSSYSKQIVLQNRKVLRVERNQFFQINQESHAEQE